jgi:hypothetical protein
MDIEKNYVRMISRDILGIKDILAPPDILGIVVLLQLGPIVNNANATAKSASSTKSTPLLPQRKASHNSYVSSYQFLNKKAGPGVVSQWHDSARTRATTRTGALWMMDA